MCVVRFHEQVSRVNDILVHQMNQVLLILLLTADEQSVNLIVLNEDFIHHQM
jgi:hypothetical protein